LGSNKVATGETRRSVTFKYGQMIRMVQEIAHAPALLPADPLELRRLPPD
jgi:hypothetical protein